MERIIIYIFSITAAALGACGVLTEFNELAYLAPAVLSAMMALFSLWRFFTEKGALDALVACFGTFLFFHFQLLLPSYWEAFDAEVAGYSLGARLLGVVGTNLFPALVLLVVRRLQLFFPSDKVQDEESVGFYNYAFLGFLVIFSMVAIDAVLFRQLIMGSLRAIFLMRGQMSNGSSDPSAEMMPVAFGSFANVQHFASSLLLLSIILLRSRYRLVISVLLPITLIWTVGSIFSMGTRTQVVQMGMFGAVIVVTNPRFRVGGGVLACVAALAVFLISQMMSFYRDVGLRDFDAQEFSRSLLEIRGLETMNDQTRAAEMYLQGYKNPQRTGIAPLDFVVGTVYRPIELIMFPVPRSLFPWKPEDPTYMDLNRWVITFIGFDPDKSMWGLTAGILGRDLLRWGAFGPFVAIFWFSVLVYFAVRYNHASFSLTNRVLAGAFVGTAMAMFRDLSPLWCLQLLPGVMMVVAARFLARRRRLITTEAPNGAGPLKVGSY